MQQSLCNTLDIVEMDLGQPGTEPLTVYIPVQDTHLSRRWLDSLDQILQQGLHLEKNYCFLGLAQGARSGEYITDRINQSCEAINRAQIGYEIPQHFYVSNCILPGAVTGRDGEGGDVNHARMNQLHRYFEDLQGINGAMSPYYDRADSTTRWHIRQLNLLCHEFESWALSWRKLITAPEWQRPSQLMCWLRAPRFELEPEDFDLFGVDTLTRPTGGVYVGINKAIGKGHWEVFVDEAGYDPDHRCDTLTTSSLRPQTLAAGDFDIEWAKSPAGQDWWSRRLVAFRTWLERNGWDPEDPALTIGHPQVAQVDLLRSFGTENTQEIWHMLNTHDNVQAIRTGRAQAEYPYHWSNPNYKELQIKCLG